MALVLLAACESSAAGADALPLAEATTRPGELFPRALYEKSAGCSFPAGPEKVLDEFRQRWFSSHLAAANELPLVQLLEGSDGSKQLLRFIWLPSFGNPIIIRIAHPPNGNPTLVAVRLSGAGGYDPGTIAAKVERELTPGEWDRISKTLARTDVLEQPPAGCDLGLDGSDWVIEAVDSHGYHFVRRWSPQDGPVHNVGVALLGLTGWDVGEIY